VCGFIGYINISQQNFTVDNELLDRMQQKIAHRGPDGSRVWSSQEHQLGLGFRRLSIIDLSVIAMQPMFDQEKSVVVCFNGEIYNYQALRKELEALGYSFFSTSDTETIIYAYKTWGIDFVHKLEGMFAIVLYDFNKRELFLIRDRIGVKPIYFTCAGGVLGFSSEIKALWEFPWLEKNLSPQALYHYLTFMVAPAPYTIYKNVYKLPAGFYLKLDVRKNISFTEWYTPVTAISQAEKKDFYDEQFCIENIRTLLLESTKKRMISDVPVGAFLSGGIDSSLNVALMTRFVSKLKVFTVAFSDGPELDELSWARIVAKKFDVEHYEITISEKEAFDFYEKMVYFLDEPLADCVCIPFYYVSKLARDLGISVVQVGEGADELFFGYPLYGRYKQVYDYLWKPSHKIMPAFATHWIADLVGNFVSPHSFSYGLLKNWGNHRSLFWGGALAFDEEQKNIIFDNVITQAQNEFVNQDDSIVSAVYKGLSQSFDSYSFVDFHMKQLQQRDVSADFCKQVFYLELKQRLPELLLMRADKMSMATSVEAREPYLDHKLVEFMYHVPEYLKYKNNTTKYLLKKVCEGILPDEIIYRKKVGFAAPTQRWLSQGNYFPVYFKRMKQNNNNMRYFTPAARYIRGTFKESPLRSAVQEWVLNNIWALR
jgi:asparagine synthase (glutamine-hydrolysing)